MVSERFRDEMRREPENQVCECGFRVFDFGRYKLKWPTAVYPMNSAWWDGEMRVGHDREEDELDEEIWGIP